MTAKIIVAIFEIIGVMGIGALARGLGYIRAEYLSLASRFVLDFLFAALTFSSILQDFEVERFGELWPLPVIGLGMVVAGGLLGIVLRRPVMRTGRDVTKTFHHFCAINNYGFLPIIILGSMWGHAAVAKLFFFNLGTSIGYWTIGVALLAGFTPEIAPEGRGRHGVGTLVLHNLRHLLTPSLVALFVALALALTGLKVYVPEVVLRITSTAGSAAVPCMLILVGAGMVPLPRLKTPWTLGYLAVLRLVLLPAGFIAVIAALPVAQDVRTIAAVVALMPTSVSSTVMARRYGGDPDFAAAAAMLTTFLSVLTLPAWVSLLTRLGVITG